MAALLGCTACLWLSSTPCLASPVDQRPICHSVGLWPPLQHDLQVLFAQQLILFAPGAVPTAKHLPLLLFTLTSSRPALRRSAAATLRHMADRDPVGLAKVKPCLNPIVSASASIFLGHQGFYLSPGMMHTSGSYCTRLALFGIICSNRGQCFGRAFF